MVRGSGRASCPFPERGPVDAKGHRPNTGRPVTTNKNGESGTEERGPDAISADGGTRSSRPKKKSGTRKQSAARKKGRRRRKSAASKERRTAGRGGSEETAAEERAASQDSSGSAEQGSGASRNREAHSRRRGNRTRRRSRNPRRAPAPVVRTLDAEAVAIREPEALASLTEAEALEQANESPYSTEEISAAATRLGISSLHAEQLRAIRHALSGLDSLVVLPTGYGKSACYQVPSLLLPKPVVVVSPLLALLEDQTCNLEKRGVPVVRIDGTVRGKARREAFERIAKAGLCWS